MFIFAQGGAIEFEAFAVGKWNGMTFERPDLEQIASNFTALDTVHKVPLKLGHNDQQPMTDGYPALGWVTKAWVDESTDKLMLRAEHVPELVQNAIKKKLYRKVSIELDLGVEHKGKKYAYVLSGVALLGADLPAVNTLADLDHYIGGESRLAASRRAEFSAVEGLVNFQPKESTMDKKEMQEMIDAAVGKAVAPLENLIKSKDAEIARFTKEKEDRENSEKQGRVKLAREQAKQLLEDAVKENKITPGQREIFTKTLGIDDDERILNLDMESLKQMIGATSNKGTDQEQGQQKQAKYERKFPDDAGKEIDHLIQQEIAKGDGKLSYSTAMHNVIQNHPDLAKEHLS